VLAAGAARTPLDPKDLRRLIMQAHPDRHGGDLRATRVTQWLNNIAGH
jgi:hypothetical protein